MDIKTKEEYILRLNEELKYLKKDDAEKILQYYYNKISSSIDYGEKEAEVLSKLPDPKDVAKEQYEARGIKYLEIKKKKEKTAAVFSSILYILLLFITLTAFVFINYIMILSIIKTFKLAFLILSSNQTFNIISFLMIIFYILMLIIILYFIIDLIVIIFTTILGALFNKVTYINVKFKLSLSSFSITAYLDNKLKIKKLPLIILITTLFLILTFGIFSYINKGYLYLSINNKTTETEIINLNNPTNIYIDAKTANINFYYTLDESYIEYNYCFKHDLNINNDSNLEINLENSETFDLFNLLKEPTQVINIFLNNNIDDLKIDIDSGEITFYENNIYQDININSVNKTTIITSSTVINNLNIESNMLYLGLNNTNIVNMNIKSTNGQIVSSNNAAIIKADINAGISKIKIEDNIIDEAKFNLSGGLIDISKCKFNSLNLDLKANQTNITDVFCNNLDAKLYTTTYLNLNEVIISDKINVDASSSYILFDYVKLNKSEINGKDSYLFLSNIGKDFSRDLIYYNDDIYDNELISIISGASSKTEIGDSIFNKVDINQINGYLLINDSYLVNGNITTTSTKGVEYNNVSCDKINLYIDMIEEKYYFNGTSAGTFEIHKCDTLSYVYIKFNDNYNVELLLDNKE